MTRHATAIELEHRVLPATPFATLDDYVAAGGAAGLRRALDDEPAALVDCITESGLRGRGGAGFPTGTKWRTVADFASDTLPTTVVVNGAEGEPGTFKDRAILRYNPYAVLEGAVIAARAVGAPSVVVAVKETFTRERDRVRDAILEFEAAGLVDHGVISVVAGPREYLYGEETALLEVVAGRPPFPRLAPPWRRGTIEAVESVEDAASDSGLPASVSMAGTTEAPPSLVNNVETLANVPGIVSRGPDWFRSAGTDESPGTVVCTVSGSTTRAGVGEIPMGTPLRVAIASIGGGVPGGRRIAAVLMGVANAALSGDQLDTPMSYEGMRSAGSGLGSAGALVFADDIDLTAVAAGVARFLAIESCGQCTPCKQDGLAIASGLRSGARVDGYLATVTDEARCALAGQQQTVVSSLLALAGERPNDVAPFLIAELIDIDQDGHAIYDETFVEKQPDWTYDDIDSGQTPVDRLTDKRDDSRTSADRRI
jgi:NADH:ubiquinone oxidoreductase subunit F (NADH-binding)